MYSTCTFDPVQNEAVVAELLRRFVYGLWGCLSKASFECVGSCALAWACVAVVVAV